MRERRQAVAHVEDFLLVRDRDVAGRAYGRELLECVVERACGNVERFVEEFPAADASRLRALAVAAKDEKRGARALKNFRELFHVLNAILQEHARGHP